MIQWLPWGRKKSFQEQAKKAYTFVIHTPYLHILIYTWYILPTFQPHTPPSYYITKLWIKHEKKNHGPPELSTVFPTLWYNAICQQAFTTDFMHTGHPVLPMLYIYICIWISNICYLVCMHVCNLKVELLRLRQKIFLVLPTKTKCFDFLE